mmetsp:Transcript_22335/g.56465  ORF Transcript_22335/g.56465 Transcript_22335/m.56465 type:complete len:490 (+) Transcript_22335:94-1563(+)|eukprot:CAMPEP_0178983328 /NCGR_PEP_ID=MMETSP0795-20121207/999_1 /TAXON_ID=88552 /ORGANISM="Amoebophrya sp., Strain Ameob2" /LENGTH=489 /DNA_ID=CAMNT_0020674089 /DNA_START=71 /DNA_END=1540 /DNA_ORIENTATION=-
MPSASAASASSSALGGGHDLDRRGCDGQASDAYHAWVCARVEKYVKRFAPDVSSGPKPDAVEPSKVLDRFRQRTQAAKFFEKLSLDLKNHHELLHKARRGTFGYQGRNPGDLELDATAAEFDAGQPLAPGARLAFLKNPRLTWYPVILEQETEGADASRKRTTSRSLRLRAPDSFLGFRKKYGYFRFSSRSSMQDEWQPLRKSLCQDQILALVRRRGGSRSAGHDDSDSAPPPPSPTSDSSTDAQGVRTAMLHNTFTKKNKESPPEDLGERAARARGSSHAAGTNALSSIVYYPDLPPELLQLIADFLDPLADVLFCPEYYFRVAMSKIEADMAPTFRQVLDFSYDSLATKGFSEAKIGIALNQAWDPETNRGTLKVRAGGDTLESGSILNANPGHPRRDVKIQPSCEAFLASHWNTLRNKKWTDELEMWKQTYPEIGAERCISESSCLATLPERVVASVIHDYFSKERGMKVTINSDDFREITLSWGS